MDLGFFSYEWYKYRNTKSCDSFAINWSQDGTKNSKHSSQVIQNFRPLYFYYFYEEYLSRGSIFNDLLKQSIAS